eukprot:Skav223517  [mRNA]  locus=scaffold1160:275654:277090:+ [translate_table: standard]
MLTSRCVVKNRVQFTRLPLFQAEEGTGSAEGSAATEDAAMGDDKHKLAQVGDKREQSQEAQPDKEPKKAKSVPWWPKKATVVPNIGKGDCLWKSLAAALTKENPAKQRTRRQLRAFVHAYMKQRSNDYEYLWINQGKFDDQGQPTTDAWEAYLSKQSKTGSWSGALELNAFCAAAERRLWVVTDKGIIHQFMADAPGEPLALKFHTYGHYEWISNIQEEEWIAAKFQQDKDGGAKDLPPLRGAGKHARIALSDFASVRISNFASSKASRVQQKPKSATSNKSAKFGRRPGLTDFASTRRRGSSKSAVPETASKMSQAVPEKPGDVSNGKVFTWACNKCQFVVKGTTWRRRMQGRCNRISRAHPNVPHSEFTNGKQQKRLFVTEVSWHDRAWICAKCRKGFQRGFSHSAVNEVATAHLKQCSGLSMRENRAKLCDLRISQTRLGFMEHYMVKKHATAFELRRAQLCRETGRQLVFTKSL